MSRICLGAIIGVHGIKGEVKVKSFAQIPEDICRYGALEDKSGTKKFELKVTGQSKGLLRAKVKGIDDRNASECLIGTELYIDRSCLPELEKDEFYHTDLIGLPVVFLSLEGRGKSCPRSEAERSCNSGEGGNIGTIVALHNFGAGDMLEIKLNHSGKTEMLPFTAAFVPEVDINNGIIISEAAVDYLQGDKENDEG